MDLVFSSETLLHSQKAIWCHNSEDQQVYNFTALQADETTDELVRLSL
jgi:hypothetical protein